MDIKIIFVAMAMVAMTHCEDCNKHLSGMSGTIKTGKYEDGLNCTWTITAPEDHSIRLEFIQFDVLSRFLNCDHDYVEVSFVRDPRPHMATFCNSFRKDHLPTGPMQSTTNVLVIRLISDKFYKNGDGFEARYVVLDKYNDPVVSEDSDDEDEDGGWDDDSTTMTSTTTTTTTTSPTTTTSTTITSSPTTTTTTRSTRSPTTTTLISKIISSTTKGGKSSSSSPQDNGSDNGMSASAGAMSGAVIGGIIGIVILVFGIILIVAFVHYKRNQNKRINLSVIETPDGKSLITDNKIYKKQNYKKVQLESETTETFPL